MQEAVEAGIKSMEEAILYDDQDDLFVGYKLTFTASKEQARYRHGIVIGAIAITMEYWKKRC